MTSSLPLALLGFLASGSAALVAGGCSSSSTTTTTTDAGSDASFAEDAAQPSDASVPDAGDAEAGTACTIAAFAGCTTFEDRTAAGAERTVTFQDFAYTPKCIRIKAGQALLFQGDFDRHPLVTSCGPSLPLDHRSGMTPASFVLSAPGRYGYYCLDHGNAVGEVMSASVDVVP